MASSPSTSSSVAFSSRAPLVQQSVARAEPKQLDVRPQARLSFEEVFDLHAKSVFRTLQGLGVHSASVDDAVQDVFLIIYEKLASFEGRSQLSTWIYAVTYRVAQNYRRRIQRRSHEELSDLTSCPKAGPEHLLAREQATTFVQKFCNELGDDQRDVFVLCVLEERVVPEAAEILGVKLNTVYSRLRATRLKFRTQLSRFRESSRAQGLGNSYE